MGSKTAAYMLRKGPYKLVYYADYEPQLFDLESDPEELNDLARRSDAKPILDDLEAELRRICDPDEVSRRAKRDQQRLLAEVGGKDLSSSAAISDFHPRRGCPPNSVSQEAKIQAAYGLRIDRTSHGWTAIEMRLWVCPNAGLLRDAPIFRNFSPQERRELLRRVADDLGALLSDTRKDARFGKGFYGSGVQPFFKSHRVHPPAPESQTSS